MSAPTTFTPGKRCARTRDPHPVPVARSRMRSPGFAETRSTACSIASAMLRLISPYRPAADIQTTWPFWLCFWRMTSLMVSILRDESVVLRRWRKRGNGRGIAGSAKLDGVRARLHALEEDRGEVALARVGEHREQDAALRCALRDLER